MSSLEYRERTVTYNPDGSVEVYVAWKRDYESCLSRLAAQGVTATLHELNPGYLITIPPEGAVRFPLLIRRRRETTEAERERCRALARTNLLHASAPAASSENGQEAACPVPAA